MIIEKRNFLPQEEFSRWHKCIDSTRWPWFWSPYTAFDWKKSSTHDGWDFSFGHNVYSQGKPLNKEGEESYKLLQTICDDATLELGTVFRIRFGLITRLPFHIVHGPHLDFPFPHINCLFYLASCNGPTIFYKEKSTSWDMIPPLNLTEDFRIESEENKYLIFPGNIYHSSSSQTDIKQRIVINFNFEVKNAEKIFN